MVTTQLLDTVRRMRAAQRQYFKTRNRETLSESIELESQVDKALAGDVQLPMIGDDPMAALRELVRAKRERHKTSHDGPDHNTLHPTRATWPDGTPCTWCLAWIRAQEIVDGEAGK